MVASAEMGLKSLPFFALLGDVLPLSPSFSLMNPKSHGECCIRSPTLNFMVDHVSNAIKCLLFQRNVRLSPVNVLLSVCCSWAVLSQRHRKFIIRGWNVEFRPLMCSFYQPESEESEYLPRG